MGLRFKEGDRVIYRGDALFEGRAQAAEVEIVDGSDSILTYRIRFGDDVPATWETYPVFWCNDKELSHWEAPPADPAELVEWLLT